MKASATTTRGRYVGVAAALAGALALSATPSAFGSSLTPDPVLVSGLDQLPEQPAAGTTDPRYCGSDPAAQEWERDNTLAVDPGNSKRVVSAWIQDWQDATTVGYSADGGRSWARTLPTTSRCTWYINGLVPPGQTAPTYQGNDFEQTTSTNDPAIAIGVPRADDEPGVTYLTEIVSSNDFTRSAAIVNQSSDRGQTWSRPFVLEAAQVNTVTLPTGNAALTGTSIDQTWVTADRAVAGTAYAVWTLFDVNAIGTATHIHFARTTDAGVTWSTPVSAVDSPEGRYSLAPQITQLADGSLLMVYLESDIEPLASKGYTDFPVDVMVTRSGNGGTTWSTPTKVIRLNPVTVPRIAAGPDGTAYLAWIRKLDNGIQPEIARSVDDGSRWTVLPAGAAEPGAPVTATNNLIPAPTLAVTRDDTLGLAFYDHRQDDPANTVPMTTTYWLRTSFDRGATWTREQLVAGPFDQSSSPDTNGALNSNPMYKQGILGDTEGIAAAGSSFQLGYVVGQPLPGASFAMPATDSHGNPNPTDLFASRLTP